MPPKQPYPDKPSPWPDAEGNPHNDGDQGGSTERSYISTPADPEPDDDADD